MPRDINDIYKMNATYFELKVKNMQIWSSIKNDAFTLLVQHIFSEGLTFQSTFTTQTMPENLRMFFRSTEELYKYLEESPQTRLDINQRGIVTIFKSEDGLILPKDVQFYLQKVHYNSQVKLQIELKKTREYLRSMQITLNKQNEALNRIKRLNHVLIKENKKLRQKCSKTPRKDNLKRSFDLTKAKQKVITEDGQEVRQVIEVADQKLLGSLMEFAQKHKLKDLRQKIRTQAILQCKQLSLIFNKIDLESLPNIPPFPFLHNLRVLSLQNNKISKMRNLSELRNIEELYLSNNSLTRIQGLQNLKYLKVLEIGWNKIEKIQKLEDNAELMKLILKRNEIKVIEGLFHLEMLEELDLSCNIIYNLPEEIQSLKSLKLLNIENNYITKLSHGLVRLEKLQEIKLSTVSIPKNAQTFTNQQPNQKSQKQHSQDNITISWDVQKVSQVPPTKQRRKLNRQIDLQSEDNKTIVTFLQCNDVRINGNTDYFYNDEKEDNQELQNQSELYKDFQSNFIEQSNYQAPQNKSKDSIAHIESQCSSQSIQEVQFLQEKSRKDKNSQQKSLEIDPIEIQSSIDQSIHQQEKQKSQQRISIERSTEKEDDEKYDNQEAYEEENSFLYYPQCRTNYRQSDQEQQDSGQEEVLVSSLKNETPSEQVMPGERVKDIEKSLNPNKAQSNQNSIEEPIQVFQSFESSSFQIIESDRTQNQVNKSVKNKSSSLIYIQEEHNKINCGQKLKDFDYRTIVLDEDENNSKECQRKRNKINQILIQANDKEIPSNLLPDTKIQKGPSFQIIEQENFYSIEEDPQLRNHSSFRIKKTIDLDDSQ